LILWEPGLSEEDPGLISTRCRAILRALSYASMPISFLAALEGIPGVTLLGDQIYRLVAAWRHKLGCAPGDTCGGIRRLGD
jgi:hypothetical protein